MRPRIVLTAATFGMMLASSTAFAESVHIRESSSVKVRSNEEGTVTTVEERRTEERGGSDSASELRVLNDDAPETVIRSEAFRRTTCYALADGRSNCTEERSGNGAAALRGNAAVRVNGNGWWSGWRERILRASRQVASETAEDRISLTLSRAEARLARRVCSRFEDDERASCLEAALDGEGPTMRLRLRDWIGRR